MDGPDYNPKSYPQFTEIMYGIVMDSNEAKAYGFLKALSNSEYEKLLDYVTDDVRIQGASGKTYGKKELEMYFKGMEPPFKKVRFDIVRTITKGETVVIERMMSGVHINEYNGIPPSNKKFEMPTVNIFDFRDGKIKAWNQYMNTKILMDLSNK